MALKAKISATEQAALKAEIKSEYKAEGDHFVLDVTPEGGFALEDVGGLKSALERERAAARDAVGKLKALEGIDPEKAREALKKVEDFKNFDPDKQVAERMKLREGELVKVHETVIKTEQGKSSGYRKQLEAVLVEQAAMKALVEAGGNPLLLTPHLRGAVRMREVDGGQLVVEVINPETGAPRVGDAQGNPMTIPQLVNEMKTNAAFAAAFAGTGSTGSGAKGGNTGSPNKPVNQPAGSKIRIARNDQQALNANWQKIRDGEAEVVDP